MLMLGFFIRNCAKFGHFMCNLRKVVFKPIVRQIKFLDKYELPVCALCGRELERCKCGGI